MNINELIHPEDAKALKALKSIPTLPKVMEKVFEYGYDEIAWSENVTTNLRLSETQMPEIYNRLPPICERLGIPVPELYLQMSPIANAWTSGHKKVYIVLSLGLVKRVKDEELDAVLAHECGHILCQHVLYQTLANAIFTFGDTIADSFVGMIGNFAMKPIRQALMVWSRASELTADRVACIFVPATTLAKALARISMIPKYIVDGMDFNAWGEQGRDYEALKNGTTWNKIVHWMADYDADHPYSPVRVFEAMKWEQTDTCAFLRSNPFKLESSAEDAPKPKQTESSGTGWSLPKIPKNVELDSLIPKFKGFKK
jgi:Zn-dependent protease with chaperone function